VINKIEISTVDNCNSQCKMCPSSVVFRSHEVMTINNFKRILNKIKIAQEQGVVSKKVLLIISFTGEPLLDPGIIDKLKLAKETVSCNLRMYTNAIRLHEFVDELNKIKMEVTISNYGDTKEQWESVTNLYISDTTFDRMKKAIDNSKNKRMWNSWIDGKPHNFTSRAGLVKAKEPVDIVGGCGWDRPWRVLHICTNGDVVLCCQDWKKETLCGNIYRYGSIKEFIKNRQYNYIMQQAEGKIKSDCNFICKRCSLNRRS